MINQQQLEGRWTELKGRITQKWGQLTESDLKQVEGNAQQLVGLIQRKTGQARERIEAELDDMLSGGGGSMASRATESVRQMASSASEQMHEARAQVSERMRGGYENAGHMVQNRPMESITAAFGAGFVFGMIVGLALRSSR